MRTIPSLRGLVWVTLLATMLTGCSRRTDGGSAGWLQSIAPGGARAWTAAELNALGEHEVTMDGGRYTGPRLTEIVGEVPGDATVTVRGSDGYTQTLSPAAANRETCIVATRRDGRGLTEPEAPLRLVVPGSPGLSVRSLASVEVKRAK